MDNGSTRPIRIVRIITRLNIGGPAIHASLLANRLKPPVFETLLITGRPESSEGDMGDLLDTEHSRRIVVPTLQRALSPFADWAAWWGIFKIIRLERPHIVHTHMAKAGTLGRLAVLLHNNLLRWDAWRTRRPASLCKAIHTFHGHVLEGYFSPHRTRLFVMIERWLARRTDCLVAVSKTVRDDLLGLGIGSPEQWRVIPLGLELSRFASIESAQAMPRLPFRVGMVGRLVPIKNPGLFLEAFANFSQGQPGRATGLIVGDGPLRQPMEAQAQRLGLDQIVRFTGWQRDLLQVYAAFDVACLTSWNEGTPVALIEAMAAGRAVVATAVGGVRDLLDEAGQAPHDIVPGTFHATEHGILVRPGDSVGLSEALHSLACDYELRIRLGRAARSHVMSRFGADRLCSDMAALYCHLAGREGGLDI